MPVAAVVEALYRALLSRAPTERELGEGEALLGLDRSATRLADVLVNRVAFDQRVSDVRARFGLSEDRLINDVSQNGEVETLFKLVINKACANRTVVDIGARGRRGSNSYDLLRYLGWKGLLVEANPRLIDEIQADFGGFDCVIESCAVSDYEGEALFTIGISDDISSLEAAHSLRFGPAYGEVTVPVRRLSRLLEQHGIPQTFDLLSLDIEGHDVRVLNDLLDNTEYRPKWIILEGPSGGFQTNLSEIGCSSNVIASYRVVANTIANLILEYQEKG